mmetsp:Transcript_30067/g.84375  ORF Transcript_30067/g.84375 Transcript_30067/m.84375 type:complete len:275 (+) Transcript_30067:191-1015(+)
MGGWEGDQACGEAAVHVLGRRDGRHHFRGDHPPTRRDEDLPASGQPAPRNTQRLPGGDGDGLRFPGCPLRCHAGAERHPAEEAGLLGEELQEGLLRAGSRGVPIQHAGGRPRRDDDQSLRRDQELPDRQQHGHPRFDPGPLRARRHRALLQRHRLRRLPQVGRQRHHAADHRARQGRPEEGVARVARQGLRQGRPGLHLRQPHGRLRGGDDEPSRPGEDHDADGGPHVGCSGHRVEEPLPWRALGRHPQGRHPRHQLGLPGDLHGHDREQLQEV